MHGATQKITYKITDDTQSVSQDMKGHLQKCQTIKLYPLKTFQLHLKSIANHEYISNISNSPRFYATTMNLSVLFVTPNQ